MNITLDRDPFLAAMQRVIGAVDRKTTIPVLQHIALKLDGDTLRLTATNLDMQATTTCPADGDDAHFTLPGQTVLDILSNWPAGGQVVISTDKDDPRISMKCGRSRFRLPTLKPDDMPIMAAPEGEGVTIDADALAAAIDAVAYAQSKDQTRFVMTGTYAHMDGEQIKLASTDNKRVATAWADCDGSTGSAILAPGFVNEAARLLANVDSARITIGSGRSHIQAGATDLIGKVIDGEFVSYQRAFENERPMSLIVGREALIGAVRRAQIVATDKERSVALAMSEGVVGVTARNMDSGEGDDEVEAQWDGEPMSIRLNGAFLVDALTHMTGDDVRLEMAARDKPIIIQEAGRATSLGVLRG